MAQIIQKFKKIYFVLEQACQTQTTSRATNALETDKGAANALKTDKGATKVLKSPLCGPYFTKSND